jgi:Tfp pilus assembly protein PilE
MKSQSHKEFPLNTESFTMMEIILVVIVIGVLGALALTRYNSMQEKIQSQEGAGILTQVYGSQKRYFLQNNSYVTSLDKLDIDIRTPKYFTAVTLPADYTQTVSCSGAGQIWLAQMISLRGGYSMFVLNDGRVVCDPCTGTICQKMGYLANW